MVITAKFASVCPCCSQRISVGSKVEWSRGAKATHVACASGASANAPRVPSQARVESTFRRRYGWDGRRGSSSYYTSGMYDEES